MSEDLRAIRFSPDEWMTEMVWMTEMGFDLWDQETRARFERLQWKLTQEILALGHSVVLEWGTWARSERDELRQAARALGAAVELHFLDAPVETLFEKIRGRNRKSPPITLDDLEKWSEMFERPSEEEMALFDPPLPAWHDAAS